MQVGDLKNFKFAVFINVECGFFGGDGGTAAHGETGFLVFGASIGEEEGRIGDFPAMARFDGVGSEENVNCCYCVMGI